MKTAARRRKNKLVSSTAEGQLVEQELYREPGFRYIPDGGWRFCGMLPSVDGMPVTVAKKSCVNCVHGKKQVDKATKTCVPCLFKGRSHFKAKATHMKGGKASG